MIKHPLAWAHPLVQEWFLTKFVDPTEPQIAGWPAIISGKPTLISAPTGSGKTLSAFLVAIDQLVRKALSGQLGAETEVLYISPLKALSNDVQKNLTTPLHEIKALAKSKGLVMADIHVAVRTGDTLSHERQAMIKKNPHILVTTPESFYILLTAEKSRALLANVKTVIIDEIHALLNAKRGSHLALSLERLEALVPKSFLRIGLSATQKPLETVAGFLVGSRRKLPHIINIGHVRQLDLAIEVPPSELGAVASNEMWDEIYDRLTELAQENRSTLIFVNTRRLAERIAHHLSERIGAGLVAAHHGSLSRKLRLNAETKLKQGEIKVLVATGSLELGIDIGFIDLVCLLGSTRSIATALQRIGRAGHWHDAISKGRIFATTRDELLECAAMVHAITSGDLDKLILPEQPLDILAQQMVASCATQEWEEDELFELVKRAYPYRHLTRTTFNQLVDMLAEGIAGSRGRYGAYLYHDKVNKKLKARRGGRITAIMSGGAIPDTGLFNVIAEPQGAMVGTLDEDFAVESNRGDVILLGTTSWRVKRVESSSGRVLVEDAHGAPPSVPFWVGEAPGRTNELSTYLSVVRQTISDLLPEQFTLAQKENALNWLLQNCHLDQSGAEQIIDYILQGRRILGAVPTQKTVIAERFFDEAGGMQLIIHAPFGARINKAWGLALRKKFCRSFNFELQAAATDNGLSIALAEQHSFPLADVFQFLHPNSLQQVLTQAVLQSPIFAVRWRWAATRSLAIVRYRYGRKTPPNILRMLADDLLAAVFPDAAACQDNLGGRELVLPDHPLTEEAMKDALHEAMDLVGLIEVLQGIRNGQIQCLAVDTPTPSPFSHEILNANPYAFLDDAPLEERRTRAVVMRRMLPDTVLDQVGKLDPGAINEVQAQAWPDIRNADELHDLLQTLIALPVPLQLSPAQQIQAEWESYFNVLQETNRATLALLPDGFACWIAAEKQLAFHALYPNAMLKKQLPVVETSAPDREEAILHMIRGWLFQLGPVTAQRLATTFQLPLPEIEQALLRLESSGVILRGQFKATETLEWCERRLLARIHRLTVSTLRTEIEPVTTAQFVRWLFTWQHVAPNTQLEGENGLLEIIKQLQGLELPANAWEKQIFAKRIKHYHPDLLDKLCLSGVVSWGRVSPHPGINYQIEEEFKPLKRINPTRVAPITFFLREQQQWMPISSPIDVEKSALSPIAQKLFQYLVQHGASFFSEMLEAVNHLKTEVESALWELVAAGLITADSFDNVRVFFQTKHSRRRRRFSARNATGRWSILRKGRPSVQPEERLQAICWQLLKRYGVVFRDLIAREKNLPRWRDLLITFRQLEDRSEIRGGRFVSGFLGEQFALPYAVDSIRASKKLPNSDEIITIAATDPLNLVGVILPGRRFNQSSNNAITFQNGEAFSQS